MPPVLAREALLLLQPNFKLQLCIQIWSMKKKNAAFVLADVFFA